MKQSIQNFLQKGKEKLGELSFNDMYIVAVIILVGFAGFGLGRLSLIEESREAVRIEFPEYLSASALNAEKSADDTTMSPSGNSLFVASKNGSRYHYPWCSGGKSISEKNKIWFDSIEDARKAGYTPAANCKGLK